MDQADLGNGLRTANRRQHAAVCIDKWWAPFRQEGVIGQLGDITALSHGDRSNAGQWLLIAAKAMGSITDNEDPGLPGIVMSGRT